jgi:hypothetical protein
MYVHVMAGLASRFLRGKAGLANCLFYLLLM